MIKFLTCVLVLSFASLTKSITNTSTGANGLGTEHWDYWRVRVQVSHWEYLTEEEQDVIRIKIRTDMTNQKQFIREMASKYLNLIAEGKTNVPCFIQYLEFHNDPERDYGGENAIVNRYIRIRILDSLRRLVSPQLREMIRKVNAKDVNSVRAIVMLLKQEKWAKEEKPPNF